MSSAAIYLHMYIHRYLWSFHGVFLLGWEEVAGFGGLSAVFVSQARNFTTMR
jgi:hypothetical protein